MGRHLRTARRLARRGQRRQRLARLLAYLIAALQKVEHGVGAGLLGRFQAPQPLPMEKLLTALINQNSLGQLRLFRRQASAFLSKSTVKVLESTL